MSDLKAFILRHRWAMLGAGIILLLGLANVKATVDTNDGSRMAVIQCLGDDGTFAIDRSCIRVFFDRITINGNTYSDKPLFLPTVLTPLYLLLKVFGITFATHFHLTVYLLNLLGIYSLNLILFWVLYHRLSQEISPAMAALGGASAVLSSLVFSYSTVLNNHTPAALVLLLLVLALEQFVRRPRLGLLLRIGLLAGLLAALELVFGAVFLLLGLGLVCFPVKKWMQRLPIAAVYLAGAAVPLGGVLVINWIAYGGILPQYVGTAAHDGTFLFGLHWQPGYWAACLFGERGIVTCSPTLLLLFFPLRAWWRGRLAGFDRCILLGLGATLGIYLLITIDFGGWCFGFRYLVPALPVLWWLIFRMLPTPTVVTRLLLAATLTAGTAIALLGAYNCWAPAEADRKPVNAMAGNLVCILYEYSPGPQPAVALMERTIGRKAGYAYLISTYQILKKYDLGRQADAEYRSWLQTGKPNGRSR